VEAEEVETAPTQAEEVEGLDLPLELFILLQKLLLAEQIVLQAFFDL
jgi:hypothetical protein